MSFIEVKSNKVALCSMQRSNSMQKKGKKYFVRTILVDSFPVIYCAMTLQKLTRVPFKQTFSSGCVGLSEVVYSLVNLLLPNDPPCLRPLPTATPPGRRLTDRVLVCPTYPTLCEDGLRGGAGWRSEVK